MASTNAIAYFPTALNPTTSVPVNFTTGINKRTVDAIGSNPAEYHLVFPQSNSALPIVIRFSTATAQGIAYSNFLKDYGNSVAGS